MHPVSLDTGNNESLCQLKMAPDLEACLLEEAYDYSFLDLSRADIPYTPPMYC